MHIYASNNAKPYVCKTILEDIDVCKSILEVIHIHILDTKERRNGNCSLQLAMPRQMEDWWAMPIL
jgi:hypothetical protein